MSDYYPSSIAEERKDGALSVLASVLVTLPQARVIWAEGTSTEQTPPPELACGHRCRGISLINN